MNRTFFPSYAVRNPWVDFSKESMTKYFSHDQNGLDEATAYCKSKNLSGVVFLADKFSVETVWENPNF